MPKAPPRLTRAFFLRPTVTVAQELLGKTLVYGNRRGRITETEAYVAFDDPGCHAFRGKTPRNAVMFDQGGLSYVYFIYGMYYCLNIVTEEAGCAAAVLIRGVLDEDGPHWNGPGKLCKAWGITTADNARDIVTDPDFAVLDTPSYPVFQTTTRIGLSKGQDKMWRYVVDLKAQP